MTTNTERNTSNAQDLTLQERVSLTSGQDFWHTQAVPRAGIDAIMLTDGPHGLRKQADQADHLGLNASVPATCFPPAVALGNSFDADLVKRVGEALGEECVKEQVSVLLGPGINIKRSPLCGRNFEYFSEDPYLAGRLGVAWVNGLQSQGVGASLKHFAANNQETQRMRISAEIDERTLREIYLRAFETVVKKAQPWTVMCSYNAINGVLASQNSWLLTDVLRGEWGFDGLVVSDWGAVANRVAAIAAGLDLQMPADGGTGDAAVLAAVESGELDAAVVEESAGRVLELVGKARAARAARPAVEHSVSDDAAQAAFYSHHALAREAAARCAVLLKNEDALLPLDWDASVAVIGEFARTPRYQGSGSSKINPTQVDTALDAIREYSGGLITFAPGFTLDGAGDADALRTEAVAAAAESKAAVVFLGLPDRAESEGFDRSHLNLPAEQLELLDAVLEANPNCVVVLSKGGVVTLPFSEKVPAILDASLLGQAGGGATSDVLYGVVNPSGRLAETVPERLELTPAYGNFPGREGHVVYGEGRLVGYRYYDRRGLDVTYPFGHGLSYTSFSYGEVGAVVDESGAVVISVDITNTGTSPGREVAQVYVSAADRDASGQDPVRALAGIGVVELAAGETQTVRISVDRPDLADWNTQLHRWAVASGDFEFVVGASSRDLRGRVTVAVEGDPARVPLSMDSSLGDLLADPVAGPQVAQAMQGMFGDPSAGMADAMGGEEGLAAMMAGFPLDRLSAFGSGGMDAAALSALIDHANSAQAE